MRLDLGEKVNLVHRLYDKLRYRLGVSLWDRLLGSLRVSLFGGLWNNLWDSLRSRYET